MIFFMLIAKQSMQDWMLAASWTCIESHISSISFQSGTFVIIIHESSLTKHFTSIHTFHLHSLDYVYFMYFEKLVMAVSVSTEVVLQTLFSTHSSFFPFYPLETINVILLFLTFQKSHIVRIMNLTAFTDS